MKIVSSSTVSIRKTFTPPARYFHRISAGWFGVLLFQLTVAAPLFGDEVIILRNPSFEEGSAVDGVAAHWQPSVGTPRVYPMADHDPATAADGTFALLCSSDSSYGAVSQVTTTVVEPGVTYRLEAEFQSRVTKDAEPGGYWLRLIARNPANPAVAYVLKNSFAEGFDLPAGQWEKRAIEWSAPAELDAVPVINEGIMGTEPDAFADLSQTPFVLEILVGGNVPNSQIDPGFPFQQTWIDNVSLSKRPGSN